MGARNIVTLKHIAIDCFDNFGLTWISRDVQNINEIRVQCGQDQTISLWHRLGILIHIVTTGTCVPARMMQFVTLAIRKGAMYDLGELEQFKIAVYNIQPKLIPDNMLDSWDPRQWLTDNHRGVHPSSVGS